MADTDIVPIVDRIVELISSLSDIGVVSDHDLYQRDDFRRWVVSDIDGVPTLRAWWVVGPTLSDPQYYSQAQPANAVANPWLWTIAGLEGLDADNTLAVKTLRNNMSRVIDVLNADRQMGGTAHRVEPCRVPRPPGLIEFADHFAAAYVEISKVVWTVSSP